MGLFKKLRFQLSRISTLKSIDWMFFELLYNNQLWEKV